MLNNINVLMGGVAVIIIVSSAFYVKSLNDQVVTCKANTKIMKERYKKNINSYDSAIIDITKYYDGKIEDLDTFKRRDNETDCHSASRFFNSIGY